MRNRGSENALVGVGSADPRPLIIRLYADPIWGAEKKRHITDRQVIEVDMTIIVRHLLRVIIIVLIV